MLLDRVSGNSGSTVTPRGHHQPDRKIRIRTPRTGPGGYRIRHKMVEPGIEFPWHIHPFPCVCLVFAGSMIETDRSERRHRQRGDLVYRPANEPHCDRIGPEGVGILTVEIEESRLSGLSDAGFRFEDSIYLQSKLALGLGLQISREILDPDPSSTLQLEGIALELLATLIRRRETSPGLSWSGEVLQFLRERVGERHSVEALAGRFDMSPAQFVSAFRAATGTSVGRFLRQTRVQLAMERLAETSLKLGDIAQALGFYDQSHFCKTFKRHTGLTPSDYRRLILKHPA